jgi:hypothetical protein
LLLRRGIHGFVRLRLALQNRHAPIIMHTLD